MDSRKLEFLDSDVKIARCNGRLNHETRSTSHTAANTMSNTPEKNSQAISRERLEGIKRALLNKRQELVSHQNTQLSALYSPDKHHLADLEEMSSDTSDTDSLCALVDIGSSTLAEIDAAIERIDQGTYGVCELCEEAIDPDRLEVLPFASLCIKCQRKKERQT